MQTNVNFKAAFKPQVLMPFKTKECIKQNDETIPSLGQTKYTNAIGIIIVTNQFGLITELHA